METTPRYDPEVFPGMAKKLCELNALNSDLAEAFSTSVKQVEQWAKTHHDFSSACIAGRRDARKRLHNMLLQIANGSEIKRERIVTIRGTPARISIREKGNASPTAVRAIFEFYEKNKKLMEIGDPWAELFRQLEGTSAKIPPRNGYYRKENIPPEIADLEEFPKIASREE